jgi:hypothetical protein
MASDYIELITKGCEELPSGGRNKCNMKSGDRRIIEADPQIDANQSKVEVLHHHLREKRTSDFESLRVKYGRNAHGDLSRRQWGHGS